MMTGQKLIKIDLSWKKYTVEPLIRPDLFPGGRATCSMLAFHYFQARDLAIGEGSFFFIATGPLVGTGFPGSNRVALSSKSVLNSTLVTEILPGTFGPALRSAGIDHLVITGRAKDLSYVVIGEGGNVNIRSKPDLAGLSGKEVEFRLKQLLGDGIAVIAAGPAGEKQTPHATLYHEENFTGAGGFGTILCSKNVKAIVIDELGEKISPPVLEPEILSSLAKDITQSSLASVAGKGLGAAGKFWYTDRLHYEKGLPAKNYYLNAYPDSNFLSMDSLLPLLEKEDSNRCNCPINCPTKIVLQEIERPTVGVSAVVALGLQCEIQDMEKILGAADRCCELGLDPAAVGTSLACLIEIVKKKKLMTEETIDWNYPGIYTFIEDFLEKRHSFSPALARGGAFLMNKYREEFPGCKGSTGMPVDINTSWGSLLQAATSNQGMPSHLNGSLIPLEFLGLPFSVKPSSFSAKPKLLSFLGNVECLLDSLIWCHDLYLASLVKPVNRETLQGKLQIITALKSSGNGSLARLFQAKKLAEIQQAILGGNITAGDVLLTGERTWIMELLFNLREGRTAADDRLPKRFFERKKKNTAPPIEKDFKEALKSYYSRRGLDSEKIPLSRTLKRLKINEIL
ncbi:MAG: aldehyde ferredoxin oxidoreductase C-terminal domain-containing protein [Candidatus Odinarchaeota archaeon]